MDVIRTIIAALEPHIIELVGAVLAAVIGRAAIEAKRRWGIEIEARHREALHSALMTGIRAALGRGLTGQKALDYAIGYAQESVPDALAKLRPAEAVLQLIARRYMDAR